MCRLEPAPSIDIGAVTHDLTSVLPDGWISEGRETAGKATLFLITKLSRPCPGQTRGKPKLKKSTTAAICSYEPGRHFANSATLFRFQRARRCSWLTFATGSTRQSFRRRSVSIGGYF